MTGRLFTAPLFVAVILLSQCNFTSFRRIPLAALFVIVIVIGAITPNSPLFSDEEYDIMHEFQVHIEDERGFYYPYTGLLNNPPITEGPYLIWGEQGLEAKERNQTPFVRKVIGFFGFYAGPEIHIIDTFALGDPLLSKLPYNERKDLWIEGWRIGHFYRNSPPGYMETLESGENVIEDKCLAKYYDKLSIITRGDLFDANRIQEIWKMNTGQYDYLLDSYIHSQEYKQTMNCKRDQ